MKTKKLFTLALAIIMLFSVLPISVSAEDEIIPLSDYGGQIKSGKTYSVSTAEEFLLFGNITGTEFNDVKIILTDNISINTGVFSLDEDKIPLYNGKAIDDSNMPIAHMPIDLFEGTFDGQGYTISGLYCSGETVGLFKQTYKASVKNLNIKNSVFIGSECGAGTFIGSCGTGTVIENCTSDAIVIGTFMVGGIAGDCEEIKNCSFNGTVIGGYYVGGIAGISYSGIKNSGNLGTVYGNTSVGGVVGHLSGYAQNCYNKGEVHGDSYVGGFVGETTYSIEYCYNIGDVYGNNITGGFVGFVDIPQRVDSFNSDRIPYLEYCYNAGEVHGTTSGRFLGASAGDFSIFNCCYYVGDDNDTANFYGDIEASYQEYLENVERDPLGMPTIVFDIGIYSISEARLRSEDSTAYFPFKISGFVTDVCNENDGYPLPKTLHKKHVWGEYVLNETDGTETSKCISDGCKATDTKKSGLNLNLWAQTNYDGSTLRFITCVDSLKYREVGFVITLADNPKQTITRSSKVVYTSIIANKQSLSAYDITGDENMKYILTFKITGLDGHQDQHFSVKPYVINLDGTTSYGSEKTFCTADMI